jgi:UDP-2-acetamido-3-amino-2,3-dideoxy-glucuronate N-acetyltransferase
MNAGAFNGPLRDLAVGRAAFFDDERGGLGVIDVIKYAPFSPVRLFWISDVPEGRFRGGHAHKLCSQFMICMSGSIRVDAFDGMTRRSITLTRGNFINVVPGIYASETFLVERSILLVLCDRPFEAEDYIDDEASLIPDAAAGKSR